MVTEAQETAILKRSRQRILNDEKLPESIRVANDGFKGVGNSHDAHVGGGGSVVGVKIGSKIHRLWVNALDDAESLLKQLGVSPAGRMLQIRVLTATPFSALPTAIDPPDPLTAMIEVFDPADTSFEV